MEFKAAFELKIRDNPVHLLPQKALFLPKFNSLLVSDIHLGKSETFQAFGIPISNQINQDNLTRLLHLCKQTTPDCLFILGDLFHSKYAMVAEVIADWTEFVNSIDADVHLIVGNHDRNMISDLTNLLVTCHLESLVVGDVRLSHEPEFSGDRLNICGHIHPCIRLQTRLDNLRLPCFFFEEQANRLILPSFGTFTGGYEINVSPGNHVYAIAEDAVIPFDTISQNKCP